MKGINPEFAKRCKEEDRKAKETAFENLCKALWELESLYEVASESDHPLEQAYELIYNFGDKEGFVD